MRFYLFPVICLLSLLSALHAFAADINGEALSTANLSPETQACISCHYEYTPGIVLDWLSSRHSKTLPADAIKKPELERRISVEKLPANLANHFVGCYECHTLNTKNHKDNFEHMGFRINVIVSPNDCKTCHPAEAEQFAGSKKAHARKNLMANSVYHTLVNTITGVKELRNGKIVSKEPSAATLQDSCLGCHGTSV